MWHIFRVIANSILSHFRDFINCNKLYVQPLCLLPHNQILLMRLYGYQEKMKAEAYKALKHNASAVLGAPTGAGKTVIFSSITHDGLKHNRKILILVDNLELVAQTSKTLVDFGIERNEIFQFTSDVNPNEHILGFFNVVICMAQTVVKRLLKMPNLLTTFNLCIIDEAHMRTFLPIFPYLSSSCKRLGVTATPIFSTKKDPMCNYYDKLVYPKQVVDLIIDSKLAQPRYIVAGGLDKEKLIYRNGEYTSTSQNDAFSNKVIYNNLLERYKLIGGQCLWFCSGIEHAERRYKDLLDNGVNAGLITSKTKKAERNHIVNMFKANKIDIIINCGVLTKGFDYKMLMVVVLERVITSISLYFQIIGRGARYVKGQKEKFTVIDGGGNISRLGFFEIKRDWLEYFMNPSNKIKKDILDASITHECNKCGYLSIENFDICPICDEKKAPEKKRDKKEAEGEFVEVELSQDEILSQLEGKTIEELTVEELYNLKKTSKYKANFIFRILRTRGMRDLLKFAELSEYKNPGKWAYKQMSYSKGFNNFKIKKQ